MIRRKGSSQTANLEIANRRPSSRELSSPKIEDDQTSKLQNLNQILLNEIKSLRDENTILSESLSQFWSQIEAANKMKEKSKRVEKELREELAKKKTAQEASISKAGTQLQEAQHKIREISAESEAAREAWELEKGELLSQIAAARKEFEAITKKLVRTKEHGRHLCSCEQRKSEDRLSDLPWLNPFGPLDMTALPGYPNKVPDRIIIKLLPKFSGNKVITAEHIDKFCNYMAVFNIEEEDVAMILFAFSLEGDALSWLRVLPHKYIKTWEQFHNSFTESWTTSEDRILLFTEFYKIKRKDLENVQEFNQRFDSLVKMISNEIKPSEHAVLSQYLSAFDGQFGFLLRNRDPTTFAQARDYAMDMEESLLNILRKRRLNLGL